MYDNYDLFAQHQARQDREEKEWLARLPVCSACEYPIRSENCWVIGDEIFCEECIDSFKDYTENHEEDK